LVILLALSVFTRSGQSFDITAEDVANTESCNALLAENTARDGAKLLQMDSVMREAVEDVDVEGGVPKIGAFGRLHNKAGRVTGGNNVTLNSTTRTVFSWENIFVPGKQAIQDAKTVYKTFMPELSLPEQLPSAALTVGFAIVWFCFYIEKIYTNDRVENLLFWKQAVQRCRKAAKEKGISSGLVKMKKKKSMQGSASSLAGDEDEEGEWDGDLVDVDNNPAARQPDMILVLPLPEEEDSAEQSGAFSPRSVARTFGGHRAHRHALQHGTTHDPAEKRLFHRINEDAEKARVPEHADGPYMLSGVARHDVGPTKNSLRADLLEDLRESLPQMGFSVCIGKTSDSSQQLVCVSLSDDEAVAKYFMLYNVRVQLQATIAEKLGISQPKDEPESSPPPVRYDPRIVDGLHANGVIAKNDPRYLYRRYPSQGTDKDTVAVQTDRFRIIYKELTEHLDVEALRQEELLQDFFPAHDNPQLQFLRAVWTDWNALIDLQFVQPIHFIREYFGSQLAFSFALLGFYCKMLLALVVPALLYETGILTLDWKHSRSMRESETRQMLGFSIILTLWAQLSSNFWDREQTFFIKSWGVDNADRMKVMRYKFQGELAPSPVDKKVMEKQYPKERAMFWRFVSQLMAAICCVTVTMCIFLERSIMAGNVYVSSYLAVQMLLCEYAYDYLAGVLTDWENHKGHAEHYNSLIWKQAIFQSVNNYYPFLHLIMQQSTRHSVYCWGGRWTGISTGRHGDCLTVLREQISMTFFFLSLFRIVQALGACLYVQSLRIRKKRRLRQAVGKDVEPSFVEKQSEYVQFTDSQQVWTLLHPVLSLGHVLLFGAAAPIVVLLCFFVFAVNLRASAFLITNFTKRPLPVDTLGVGEWRPVLRLLTRVGCVTTGFLLVTYGESFRDVPLITRLTGFIIYMCVAMACNGIMSILCPRDDHSAQLLMKRRRHVERTMMRKWHYGEDATASMTPRKMFAQ